VNIFILYESEDSLNHEMVKEVSPSPPPFPNLLTIESNMFNIFGTQSLISFKQVSLVSF
jgi:hypothetical protein